MDTEQTESSTFLGQSRPPAEPVVLVSVVIPTYNSGALVGDGLEALARQTMPADQMEVIIVDDGSTDGTWAQLRQWAGPPGLRIFQQPHSGTPSAGRNTGLRHARGKYVFFHDADDQLGEDALRRLVAVAEREGSDVVVGRVCGVGQPSPSGSAGETVLDADLLDDGVWRSLSPHKLFSRALVDGLGLVFQEDMVQGEDQVFVASCLFAARKVSVLRDYDYYHRRRRSDGKNLSRQGQSLQNKLLTCTRMTALVVAHSCPGDRREKLLRRVLVGTLAPGLAKPYMRAQPAEREAFLSELKNQVLPFLSSQHLSWANEAARARLAVAKRGRAEDLVCLNEVLGLAPRYVVEQGVLTRDFGDAINSLLPATLRKVDTLPVLGHRILAVERVRSGFRLRVQLTEPPVSIDRIDVIARLRGADVRVPVSGRLSAAGEVTCTLSPRELSVAAESLAARRPASSVEQKQTWDFTLLGYVGLTAVSRARLSWGGSAVLPGDSVGPSRLRPWGGLRANVFATKSFNVSLTIQPVDRRERRWPFGEAGRP